MCILYNGGDQLLPVFKSNRLSDFCYILLAANLSLYLVRDNSLNWNLILFELFSVPGNNYNMVQLNKLSFLVCLWEKCDGLEISWKKIVYSRVCDHLLFFFENLGYGAVVHETELIRDLLKDYDHDARPVKNQSDYVKVELQMFYKELKEIVCT